jgi:hypothetical protein
MGHLPEAQEAFMRSTELVAEDPYEFARARATWGVTLATANPEQSQMLLEQTRATFRDLGARHDLAAIEPPPFDESIKSDRPSTLAAD